MPEICKWPQGVGYNKEYCSDDVERRDVRREVEGDESTKEQDNTINGMLIVLYLEEFRSEEVVPKMINELGG
jgi:hypothetical protein